MRTETASAAQLSQRTVDIPGPAERRRTCQKVRQLSSKAGEAEAGPMGSDQCQSAGHRSSKPVLSDRVPRLTANRAIVYRTTSAGNDAIGKRSSISLPE